MMRTFRARNAGRLTGPAGFAAPRGADGPSRRRRAFTLIELLVVVAIVAILSAIALPNFLEAQTRGKVARAHSDMRTIALALENLPCRTPRYPLAATFCAGQMDSIDAYNRLSSEITTPVAYLPPFPSIVSTAISPTNTLRPAPAGPMAIRRFLSSGSARVSHR
jgi:prepilin-type N-terminal cleavage/methylation domain-containing protein